MSKPDGKPVKRKQRNLLFKLLLCAVAGYFALQIISLQVNIERQQALHMQLEAEKKEQEAENARLQKRLDEGITPQEAIAIAREAGYVLPGERVFVDSSNR